MELQNYQKYITGSGHVVVYAGERVALVLPDTARTASFNPDKGDPKASDAMELVVSNLQKMPLGPDLEKALCSSLSPLSLSISISISLSLCLLLPPLLRM